MWWWRSPTGSAMKIHLWSPSLPMAAGPRFGSRWPLVGHVWFFICGYFWHQRVFLDMDKTRRMDLHSICWDGGNYAESQFLSSNSHYIYWCNDIQTEHWFDEFSAYPMCYGRTCCSGGNWMKIQALKKKITFCDEKGYIMYYNPGVNALFLSSHTLSHFNESTQF